MPLDKVGTFEFSLFNPPLNVLTPSVYVLSPLCSVPTPDANVPSLLCNVESPSASVSVPSASVFEPSRAVLRHPLSHLSCHRGLMYQFRLCLHNQMRLPRRSWLQALRNSLHLLSFPCIRGIFTSPSRSLSLIPRLSFKPGSA